MASRTAHCGEQLDNAEWPAPQSWRSRLPPPNPDEFADLARGALNRTVLEHLPADYASRGIAPSAGIANVFRRVRMDVDGDILRVQELVDTVNDVLELVPIWAPKLPMGRCEQYLAVRFLVPRFRVVVRRPAEEHPIQLGTCRHFVFDPSGCLQGLSIDGGGCAFGGVPDPHPLRAPIPYYRAVGRLIETPEALARTAAEPDNSMPVFAFAQVWELMHLQRVLNFTGVNLFWTSVDQYVRLRGRYFRSVRRELECVGMPTFCARPACMAPFAQRRTGQIYCSDRCRTQEHERRKKAAQRSKAPPVKKERGQSPRRRRTD